MARRSVLATPGVKLYMLDKRKITDVTEAKMTLSASPHKSRHHLGK